MSSRPNQGGLWENTRKFNPSDPDFTGVINVNGTEIKFVAWHSTSTNPKAPKLNIRVDSAPVFQTTTKEKDDDIPF